MANIILSEEEYNELKQSRDSWRERYYEIRYAYEDIQEWKEKCISRGNENDHLLSENKEKDKKISEKEVEIKKLKKEIINLGFDRVTVKSITEKNSKLKQTISDQEVTIKALLITIKELCKEDETNE